MGSCTSKKSSKGDTEKAIDRNWVKTSGCIDKFVFETSIKSDRYLKIQLLLLRNCYRLDFSLDPLLEESCTINSSFIEKNKEIITKGVPNYSFFQFLFCMFNMKIAENSTNQDNYFTEEENEKLKGIDKSLFGRNKITSNFLNTKGMSSLDKILHCLREEFPLLQYCPILPRVVQMLLWYVPEKIALKMASAMLDENNKSDTVNDMVRTSKAANIKYFSTNIKFTKGLKSFARKKCKVIADKKTANKILEDLIDNMCLQVIPAEVIGIQYIPVLFCGYLVSGIYFIANLAGAIYSRFCSDKTKTIEHIKNELFYGSIYGMILRSHSNLLQRQGTVMSSDSKMSEIYSTYAPMSDKPSKILPTNEKKNQIYSLIPKIHQYSHMKKAFAFEQNGLLIKELDYFWRKSCLASMLLIEAEDKIFGLFLDRELTAIEKGEDNSQSLLFVHDSHPFYFTHMSEKKLIYKFNIKTGIEIGGPEVFTIKIHSSLLEIEINNESTFGNIKGSEVLPEGSFDISNIELFLMR